MNERERRITELHRLNRYLQNMGKPLAHGYVLDDPGIPGYGPACCDLIVWWCTERGWRIGVIFTDRMGSSRFPGFTALLDALRTSSATAAVLLSPAHLGPSPRQAVNRASAIRGVGAEVVFVAPAAYPQPAPDDEPSQQRGPAVQPADLPLRPGGSAI